MRADPVNTGFAFSPSLQKRAKLVDEFTKDIAYFSWMFASPSRMNFIKTELYSKKLPDYFAEANEIKQKALEAYKMPLLITGYVAASGNFVLDGEPSEVMGLNVKGDFEAVTESTAAKFTPLFKKQ